MSADSARPLPVVAHQERAAVPPEADGLMACPQCGYHSVIAEIRSTESVRVAGIDRGAVAIYVHFESTEWEVEDVYCDECDWTGGREIHDYEWVGNYPPEGKP